MKIYNYYNNDRFRFPAIYYYQNNSKIQDDKMNFESEHHQLCFKMVLAIIHPFREFNSDFCLK